MVYWNVFLSFLKTHTIFLYLQRAGLFENKARANVGNLQPGRRCQKPILHVNLIKQDKPLVKKTCFSLEKTEF